MKKALIISLTLNIIIVSAFAIKRVYYSNSAGGGLSQWSITWNAQKNDLYNVVPIDTGDIVFIGDSHIERFLLNDYFPGIKIRNRGIGSNTTIQVIDRLPGILQKKPSKLFVQVGINDLAFGFSADSAYNNITTIIQKAKSAKTVPYLISVFPTAGADRYLNSSIAQLNNKLAAYCALNNVLFIDMSSLLAKHGELDHELTIDSSHLNSKGYALWKNEIEHYIR